MNKNAFIYRNISVRSFNSKSSAHLTIAKEMYSLSLKKYDTEITPSITAKQLLPSDDKIGTEVAVSVGSSQPTGSPTNEPTTCSDIDCQSGGSDAFNRAQCSWVMLNKISDSFEKIHS